MGITAGPFKTHEDGSAYVHRFAFHDSAAVLLDDGKVVAAIETERLNRIKHTNKFPIEAIRFCLENYGVRIQDLDYLAYNGDEAFANMMLEGLNIRRTLENQKFDEFWDARSLLQNLLSIEFNHAFPQEKLGFINHHQAHALSAFLPSGFDESLILTLDGQGDNESGRVIVGNMSSLETLASFPVPQSLGGVYANIIGVMGFQNFDEYKAMGLAPYGDPARFSELFNNFYTLLPDGQYTLNYGEIQKLYRMLRPRKKREAFTQDHMDIAACLQESLEKIVFHILSYYREKTNQRNLCFAGGVGHNCSLNGKILNSGMFDNVFVQPASHDAGCAYGAALSIYFDKPEIKIQPLRHLYWGSDIGEDDAILAALAPWRDFISVRTEPDICRRAAELIADGNVIGWVQGRSEFGPRALGNRSILADPRPEENKEIINAMVKKREAFRPFAPSVLEEYAQEYFEVDASGRNLSYMIFVVNVRPEKRKLLGAITHVDGTARIQTVSKSTNEKYWNLIDAFNEITGIPMLLNTSFNNNAEPIVDSVEDAVVCFLTTKLNYLVIGDCLINKKEIAPAKYMQMIPSLPKYTMLYQVKRADDEGRLAVFYECKTNFDLSYKIDLSAEIFKILIQADGQTTLAHLMSGNRNALNRSIEELYPELYDLWSRRLITLKPSPTKGRKKRNRV
jgi:carbamoyltransferase